MEAPPVEGLVKGGEICVSRGVRDNLRHRGGMIFEDLGPSAASFCVHPRRAGDMQAADLAQPATAGPTATQVLTVRNGGGLAYNSATSIYHPCGCPRDGICDAT
jgi:hypothetical protein